MCHASESEEGYLTVWVDPEILKTSYNFAYEASLDQVNLSNITRFRGSIVWRKLIRSI